MPPPHPPHPHQPSQEDCCICSEKMSPRSPIWTCQRCTLHTHFTCLRRWARTGTRTPPQAPIQTRTRARDRTNEPFWTCPACIKSYTGEPGSSTCFCGRFERSEYDLSHSFMSLQCGETCGRARDTCQHECTQLCHPGRCEPCKAVTWRVCPCGSSRVAQRCNDNDDKIECCRKKCEKKLTCRRHFCQQICHLPGKCPPCEEVIKQTCWCGENQQIERLCLLAIPAEEKSQHGLDNDSTARFSCLQPCNKMLSCGHHRCVELCHSGACPPCSLVPQAGEPQKCACGRIVDAKLPRSSCLDPLPSCGKPCQRILSCQHTCSRLCHSGSACGLCQHLVNVACVCGRKKISLTCEKAARTPIIRCSRQCRSLLSCGLHKCLEKCCDCRDHLCTQTCDRLLICGVHKHTELCHGSLPCGACSVIYRNGFFCACGRTHSGRDVRCGTPINCSYTCNKLRKCGHACLLFCHFGSCDTVAPCAVLTQRTDCAGGHRKIINNTPCFASNPSCGTTCEKPLPCAVHTCLRPCHAGECLAANGTCKQRCARALVQCGHPCQAMCHGQALCPGVPCNAITQLSCPCGRRTREVKCSQVITSNGLECDRTCTSYVFGPAENVRCIQSPYPTMLLQRILDLHLEDICTQQERKLNDWLDTSSAKSKYFAPASRIHRWLSHQLASIYQLQAESYDQEPYRSVRFSRTHISCIPSVALSSAARTYGKQIKSSMAVPKHEPSTLLYFLDLKVKPVIHPNDLKVQLFEFSEHYRLNWTDCKNHASAVFDSASLATRARQSLLSKGVWRDTPDSGSVHEHVLPPGTDEASMCLYRSLFINEQGQSEGVERVRHSRKQLHRADEDGFVTVNKGNRSSGKVTHGQESNVLVNPWQVLQSA